MEIVTLIEQFNKTSLLRGTAISKLLSGSRKIFTLVENRSIFLEKSDDSDDYEAWVAFKDGDNQIRVADLLEFIIHLDLSDSYIMDDHKITMFVKAGGQAKHPKPDF